jgi:hypothetical protein
LDDEPVEAGFFSRKKTQCASIKEPVLDDCSYLKLPLVKKLKGVGFSDTALATIATYDPFQEILKEPEEEMLIVTTIKNQTAEKKA